MDLQDGGWRGRLKAAADVSSLAVGMASTLGWGVADLLLPPLARAAGRDYLPDALMRQTHTTSQGGKSARGRRLNVKKAFAVTEEGRRRVRGRRILLVDDVLTTGATAEVCARALIEAGARAVDLAVVARVRTSRKLPT